MPLFQDQIRRIFEQLGKLRSQNTTSAQNSLAYAAEALEDVTEAVKNIEQRLQQLEERKTPGSF